MDDKDESFSKQGIAAFVLAVISVITSFLDLGGADLLVAPLFGLGGLILGIRDLRAGNKRLLPMIAVILVGVEILITLFILITGIFILYIFSS